jgi:hypothetical protein
MDSTSSGSPESSLGGTPSASTSNVDSERMTELDNKIYKLLKKHNLK